METETLLDLLQKEQELIHNKRYFEHRIMVQNHKLIEAEQFPEFSDRYSEELIKEEIDRYYEKINDIEQELPKIRAKIKIWLGNS